MQAQSRFLGVVPVLPSADIDRDLAWYQQMTGFEKVFADTMYAVIRRENTFLHLQWHADTADDPLLGGSVIRILVENIDPLFEEFVQRGTVTPEKFVAGTSWGTNEFGFFDLNRNAIFMVEIIP
ncbi:MAG: hypothetical protein JNK91_06730 [Ferruginibacter sp.]|nr:hypothetical protein [Ferruginibacter sp.]